MNDVVLSKIVATTKAEITLATFACAARIAAYGRQFREMHSMYVALSCLDLRQAALLIKKLSGSSKTRKMHLSVKHGREPCLIPVNQTGKAP